MLEENAMKPNRRFLNVGCGPKSSSRPKGFHAAEWEEIRLYVNPNNEPDIVGSMTDLSLLEDGSFDAIYSSHNLEHLFTHEVPVALAEFHRILAGDGFVVATCPDLQSVCAIVAEDRLSDPLYDSPAGPITALDILYGHVPSVEGGNTFMAHKCGFTYNTLYGAFANAGFPAAIGGPRPASFDLWIVALKRALPEAEMQALSRRYLP